MAYTSTNETHTVPIRSGLVSITADLRRFVSRTSLSLGNWFFKSVRTAQYNRMRSVLQNMPDHVLEEIGVNREEIPDYAHSLVLEGQDQGDKK